jgi:hypothetical protein
MLITVPGKVLSATSDNVLGTTSDQMPVVTSGVVPANTPQQDKGAIVTDVPIGIPSCEPAATSDDVTGITTPSLPASAAEQEQARDLDEALDSTPYRIPNGMALLILVAIFFSSHVICYMLLMVF